MTQSTAQKLPLVIDYLTAGWTTALGTSVDVFDGPVASSASSMSVVFVGDDDDPDSDNWVGEIQQEYRHLGPNVLDEQTRLTCCASYSEGDSADSFKAVRDAAFALVKTCEDFVRNDITLGGLVNWARLTTGTLRQSNTKQGPLVRVTFYITYKART